MATQVFLHNALADTHRGTNTAKLDTTTSGWLPFSMSTSRGDGAVASEGTATVAGATNGVEVRHSGTTVPGEWLSPPVDADVTISGAITGNIWAAESNMSANVAINFKVDKVAATDGTVTQIVKSARTTEVAVTTRAVNNFTATPGAGVSLNKGDRLRVTIFGDDAGTMASGFAFTIGYAGVTGGVDGDTYISFTETFGFQTTTPTGTQLFLTDTASAVSTADVDFEAWTSRGNSTVSATNPLTAGWTTGVQAQSGGTNVSWFTRPLTAFTLDGVVLVNAWGNEGSAAGNLSFGVEIAIVAGDGTGATIWGRANRDAGITFGSPGELDPTSISVHQWFVSGDTTAITDGQRLRVRVWMDDCADVPMSNSTNAAIRFDGPTGGVSGDTYLTFGQTLTEFSATVASLAVPRRQPDRAMRDFDPWSVTGWQ